MKRRIISALLLIVMLISLVPAQAFAQETTADELETLPEAQQIPAEETIPDEEVEIIPMPDAEYEEIIEEPEEDPAEEPEPTDEPEEDEEPAEKVSVRFDLTPAELTLRVYHAEEYTAAEPQPIAPEADGTYLLLPGEYCYDAECEGYIPVYNCAFTVSESTEIAVALEADSESTVSGTSTAIASGSCGENLTWTLDENGVLTISGTGAMADYEVGTAPWLEHSDKIKTVVIESGVTSIGDYAFESYSALTSVTIPEGVTSIGDSTFYNCYALTSVTLPDSVTSIGWGAFYRCPAITSMTIPTSVTSIGFAAFSGCTSLASIEVASGNEYYSSLDGVLFNKNATELVYFPSGRAGDYTIPNGVISIGNNAFGECEALTSVTIPNSVTSIGNCAFALVGSLKDVYYLGTQEQWKAITIGTSNDELINAEIHFAPAISGSCGENLTWTLDESGLLTISGTGDMENYEYDSDNRTTAPWSKYSETIITVVIEPGVTGLGNYAFNYCSKITSVTMPNSVTSIGKEALRNCKALTSIEVASDNEYYSSLDGVLFNKDATELVRFPGGLAGTYTIPGSVTSIGDSAFSNCTSLTSVTIPGSVTSLGDSAFWGCGSLTNVTIPGSVTSIGYGAFAWCSSFTSMIIPNSVTSIGDYVFHFCEALTTVTIGNGVTSLGEHTFFSCTALESVAIPDSVTSIGDYAFTGCNVLTDVYYTGTKAQWDTISIGADNEPLLNAVLHTGYMVSYDANGGEGAPAAQVKNPGEDITLSTVIPTRENHKFLGWRAFTPAGIMVYQPGDVYTEDEDIYLTAMWRVVSGRCGDNLTFTLDDAGTLAVSGAGDMYDYKTEPAPWRESGEYITSITVGEGVTSIGAAAFGSLENLKNLSLPSTLNKIGDYAIGACTSLTSVTIPENVGEIGIWAFTGLWSLEEISIPGSIAKISEYAFAGCNALRKLTLNGGTTAIGKYAFTGCTSLTELTLPDGLETVDGYAFRDCEVITKLSLPASVTSIADGAFSGCTALTDVHYAGTKAQWDAISIGAENEPLLNAVIHTGYMVSYDANGGEGAPAVQVKEKGKALKLSTVIPTRRHFTFLGWATTRTAKSAQYKAGASYTKDADVTLYAVWKPVLATKITVTPATAALCGANRTLELTASVLPAEADDTVTWSSSNEKIATVDENGVVTTHGVYGTVTITAAAADGSRRTGKCTLTVKSPLTEALTIRDSDGAECNGKAVFFPLISGSKYQYTAERTPADSASAVKWTSSNARVVTVSAAGLVSVKGVGSAVITAKSADTNAASASFTVSVVNFTPTLSAKTVTINSFFDNGTDISVTCAPDSSLMSLELCTKSGSSYVPLDKIDVEDMGEAGFRLRAVEAKRASYSAFAKAVLFCEGVGYVNYYLPLRIAVVNTAPTVKVTGEKINTFYPGWEWGITPNVKGGTVEHYELAADSNPNFELTDGGKLRLSEAGMAAVMANPRASIVRTPVKLVFSFENTKNTVTVSYRPTVVFSKPTARITLEKINPFYVERAWNVTPTVTNGKLDYYEVENNGNEILTVNGEGKIVLTAAAKALVRSNPKARLSSGALKFILHFEDTPITQEISVRPSIGVSTPRFAARDAQTGKAVSYVTFNRFFNADTVEFELYDSASKAAVTPGSCTVSDPVQVFGTYSDGSTIGITCNNYDAKKSRAVLEFASEDWLTPVKLTMNVRYAAAPRMTLTASGRIDLIDRAGTGITYTPRFTNAAGSVMQGMKLETVKDYAGNDVTDAFELVYDHGTGKAALRANEGSALVKKAYSVTVSAELALGEEICTVYTTVRVTPVQTALRLKASAMKIKQGGGADIVIETVPAGCELASAEVSVPKTAAGKLTAEIDAAEKLLTVAAADDLNPGTYTLTVTALPKDAAVGTAPTKLTVRVTVVKTH